MFFVAPEVLVLFCLTELAFSASPGPAVLMVVSRVVSGGIPAAMAVAFGVLCGNLFYFALSATAIGAFLFALREWFFVVQWCGAFYLFYLAGVMFFGSGGGGQVSRAKAFGESLAAQLANPKTIIFFIAFLPLFINPSQDVGAQIAVLAAASFAVEFCVLSCYAFAAKKFIAIPGARARGIAEKIGALLLCAAAVSLAFITPE
ncbi:MAG: LysE family translocator [Gammaproteobacteria bacterium WSBS_2016_MAG_OTU1]